MRKTDQDLEVEIEPRTKPNWGKKITKSNIFLELKHKSQRQSSTENKREKRES